MRIDPPQFKGHSLPQRAICTRAGISTSADDIVEGILGTSGRSRSQASRPPRSRPWLKVSGITEGPIFRRILKGGRILDEGLDPTAILKIVKQRCLQAGLQGDFRRTRCVRGS